MKEKINRRTTILVALFLITTVFIAASLYAVSNRPAENANRISACDDPTPDSLHADSVFEQDYTRLPVDEETEIDILTICIRNLGMTFMRTALVIST